MSTHDFVIENVFDPCKIVLGTSDPDISHPEKVIQVYMDALTFQFETLVDAAFYLSVPYDIRNERIKKRNRIKLGSDKTLLYPPIDIKKERKFWEILCEYIPNFHIVDGAQDENLVTTSILNILELGYSRARVQS